MINNKITALYRCHNRGVYEMTEMKLRHETNYTFAISQQFHHTLDCIRQIRLNKVYTKCSYGAQQRSEKLQMKTYRRTNQYNRTSTR